MKLDYGKIEEYVLQLKTINNNMTKELDTIKSCITSINSNWTGSAADNYVSKLSKMSNVFSDFSRELNACALYLQKCSDRYEELDQSIKQEIQDGLINSKIFN